MTPSRPMFRARSRPALKSARPVQRRGLSLRRRGRCLSLSGRLGAAADARPQKRQASGQNGDPAMAVVARFAGCVAARALPCPQGRAGREIERWADEDVIERHRARMRATGKDMMRRPQSVGRTPLCTLKCRAGYRHFLVRGFDKVRGEWSLMALCYNSAGCCAL